MSHVPVQPEMEDLDDILARLGLANQAHPVSAESTVGHESEGLAAPYNSYATQSADYDQENEELVEEDPQPVIINPPPQAAMATKSAHVDPKSEEKVCPKCQSQGSWGQTSWCPRCGYYPKAGEDTIVGGHIQETAEVDHTRWFICFGVGVILTLVVSLVGTFITSQNGWDRTNWTLFQAFVGSVVFAIGHFWAFGLAMSVEEKMELLDVFVSPAKVWHPTIQRLPKTWLRLSLATWGALLTVFALTIVGGVRYYALFEDWGFHEKPKEKQLMKELVKGMTGAAKDGEEKSMEEIMEEMIGDTEEEVPVPEPLPRERLHCVILGYIPHPDSSERVKELILGGLIAGKLRLVGSVTKPPKPEYQIELVPRLQKLHRSKPFIKLDRDGVQWVRPEILCNIAFKGWNEADQMEEAVFAGFTDPNKPDEEPTPAVKAPETTK